MGLGGYNEGGGGGQHEQVHVTELKDTVRKEQPKPSRVAPRLSDCPAVSPGRL